jgi:hypothetical protein
MSTPAMRLKSHWFKPGAEKSPAEQASAMAFIVFRVAQNLLKRMRGAHFDIDAGPPYFAFLREVLVFLVAITDRMAHARLDAPRARNSPWPWCATLRAPAGKRRPPAGCAASW